jgi:hypothetical protein
MICIRTGWPRLVWRLPISGVATSSWESKTTRHHIQRVDLQRWVMDTVFGRTVHPMILPFYEEI